MGGGAGKKCKEMFGFARASPRARPRRLSAQSGRTPEFQATTHAERAKWVRAKDTISPQIETSSDVRAAARSAAEEWAGRKPRREAAKLNGAAAGQDRKVARDSVSCFKSKTNLYERTKIFSIRA